eukprot:SAG22_NODE_1755_length_3653_cov_20.353967_4_plen_116_part_00
MPTATASAARCRLVASNGFVIGDAGRVEACTPDANCAGTGDDIQTIAACVGASLDTLACTTASCGRLHCGRRHRVIVTATLNVTAAGAAAAATATATGAAGAAAPHPNSYNMTYI